MCVSVKCMNIYQQRKRMQYVIIVSNVYLIPHKQFRLQGFETCFNALLVYIRVEKVGYHSYSFNWPFVFVDNFIRLSFLMKYV